MGTRGTVTVSEDGVAFFKMYRQYDSYVSGMGKEIADFLASRELVNGIPYGQDKKYINGAGDLAALLILLMKEDTGGIYVIPLSEEGQEYDYYINVNNTGSGWRRNPDPECDIKVVRWGTTIFEGNTTGFIKFVEDGEPD